MDDHTYSNGRKAPDPWDIGFGVAILAASLAALFIWFPIDIPGGFFEVNAIGREEPGDAFFPILLAVLLVGLSVIQTSLSIFRKRQDTPAEPGLTYGNLGFLARFLAVVAVGLVLMYGLGPVTVLALNAVGFIDASYRELTDTAPYKYIGYVIGGFLMATGLIVWTEGRVRKASVISVVVVLVVSILIFDVFLNNVLLPPNAEF